MLKELLRKLARRKEKFSEMEEDDRLSQKVQERKLSANERELLRYLEEERQENIKKQLDGFRKKKQHEYWHKDVITQKDIFKGHQSIMEDKPMYFKKGNMLKSKLTGGFK